MIKEDVTNWNIDELVNMLVLRRKRGQSIVIGKDQKIIIKVLKDESGVITIGVDAPKSVPVDRLEIYEKRNTQLVTY